MYFWTKLRKSFSDNLENPLSRKNPFIIFKHFYFLKHVYFTALHFTYFYEAENVVESSILQLVDSSFQCGAKQGSLIIAVSTLININSNLGQDVSGMTQQIHLL